MAGWNYSQDKHKGVLKTPLGKDKFVLTWFEGTEAMSEPFEFRIEALHELNNVDLDTVIGQNCSVSIETLKHGKRYFVGVLAQSRLLRETTEGFLHELILRPWFWLLKHRINSRIFHNMTPVQVIQKIFEDHSGYAKYTDRTGQRQYPTMEYCVQHNESDFDFVSRLMEAHGISYRFEFAEDKHTMILGDGTGAYDPIPGSTRKFINDTGYHQREEEHVYELSPARQFTTGKATVNDYDLHNPNAQLKSEKSPVPAVNFNPGELEDYTHPYNNAVNKGISHSNGDSYATARIDMWRSEDGRYVATGDLICAAAGLLLTMQQTLNSAFDKEFLILQVRHRYGIQSYRSGSRGVGENVIYQASCVLFESSRPFAPAMITRKPVISGPQTGKVVTKVPGQNLEIDCDALGRVWVHFHWDRADEGSKAEARTMPCRVAQVWAGNKWGGIYIPRVGMEVLVHFIDGDPDRPIIIGTVYNGDEGSGNMPPYDLPSQKNLAGWKSQSTPNKPSGYNEIVMDDTAGSELMRVHAEYDLDSTIEHDQRHHVKNDNTTNIDNNETRTIGVDRMTKVKNNDTLDTTNEILIKAGTKITLQVGTSTIVIDSTSISITTGDLTTNGKISATHLAGGTMVINGKTVAIN